ncbi:CU044_5270 family protein [Streptomyces sp. NPDC059766]|uniref:CU044_5270 family protein n=1 Tax=Streptomyces sp. NPDC059766 TaxID=3346940 RepID=UPI00366924A9
MTELPERDLPPGRHRLLKEHLMSEIWRAEDSPRVHRAWLRPVLVAGSVAAVSALTFALVAPSGGDTGPGAQRSVSAGALLESMATAVEHQHDGFGEARDGQYMYVDKKVSSGDDGKSTGKARPRTRLEVWVAVGDTGRARQLVKIDGQQRDERAVAYAEPSSLPVDADGMYTWLKEEGAKTGRMRDALPVAGSMFTAAGGLMENGLLSAEQTAALYRAVARIPGVTVVGHAVDAAGRDGVALVHQEPGSPGRDELIFDRRARRFLGTSFVYTEDQGSHKKGSTGPGVSILRRAIVDRAGQQP